MAETERHVRVFISSTFRDMHAERDHLVTVVFPELRERLERLGLDLYDVDLRWGVPEVGVDGERANSWQYCKQWIDRVEPFFICLLGQRYGFTPPAEEIIDPADRSTYAGLSITEMEIRHAVLDGSLRRRAYFYLRDAVVPEDAPPEVRGEFVDPALQDRLTGLKERIRGSGRPVRDYDCRWTGNGFDSLDEFGERVLEDLWSGVLRDERYVSRDAWTRALGHDPEADPIYVDEDRPIPVEVWERVAAEARPPPRDPLDAEAEQMADFAESRLGWFQGRHEELAELERFVTDPIPAGESRLCVVRAVPGQGKSALLAKFADGQTGTGNVVVAHYVGATERSADLRWLLDRLVRELDRAGVAPPEEDTPGEDVEGLRRRLADRLEEYRADAKVILLIDAVNQLEGGHDLSWIPHRLGPGVRVVVSCIDDPAADPGSPQTRVLSAIDAMRPPPRTIDLPPLDEDDVRAIVVDYLAEYSKELDREHIDAISRMQQARNPLYLLVMLNELRTLGGNEMHVLVPALIKELPEARPDAVHLFDWVLERLEVFGVDPLRLWCTYLALGRVGMASRELSDLLAGSFGEDASRTALRIERGIRRYLQRRGAQLDFFHAQLRTAVERRYLSDAARAPDAHRALGHYFRRRADPSDARTWDGDPRGLSELPYHLTAGADNDATVTDEVVEILTDFRFLERKATDVDVAEQTSPDGETATFHAGVFALRDDMGGALTVIPGSEVATRPRMRVVVTPTDVGDGSRIFCPHCAKSSASEEEGDTDCPQCGGPLRVNGFVLHRDRVLLPTAEPARPAPSGAPRAGGDLLKKPPRRRGVSA